MKEIDLDIFNHNAGLKGYGMYHNEIARAIITLAKNQGCDKQKHVYKHRHEYYLSDQRNIIISCRKCDKTLDVWEILELLNI